MSKGSSKDRLSPALYLVSTPLGNARDITLRALDVLRAADVLAAEDTRTLRRLMEIHGIELGGRRIVAYHDHSGARERGRLTAMLEDGQSVAYAPEAGTPLVADPGYALAREAAIAGVPVVPVPGPSAFVAALTVSGLPSDRFTFLGFPPAAAGGRRKFFEDVAEQSGTLVLYESPRRLGATLAAAVEALGGDRPAAVCRELTKKFEEVRRGSLSELAAYYAEAKVKGEVAVCIGEGSGAVDSALLEAALREAMKVNTLKDAAREVSDRFGVSRRDMYQLGLKLER